MYEPGQSTYESRTYRVANVVVDKLSIRARVVRLALNCELDPNHI